MPDHSASCSSFLQFHSSDFSRSNHSQFHYPPFWSFQISVSFSNRYCFCVSSFFFNFLYFHFLSFGSATNPCSCISSSPGTSGCSDSVSIQNFTSSPTIRIVWLRRALPTLEVKGLLILYRSLLKLLYRLLPTLLTPFVQLSWLLLSCHLLAFLAASTL